MEIIGKTHANQSTPIGIPEMIIEVIEAAWELERSAFTAVKFHQSDIYAMQNLANAANRFNATRQRIQNQLIKIKKT